MRILILCLTLFAVGARSNAADAPKEGCISKSYQVHPCVGLLCESHSLTLNADCTASESTQGLTTQFKYELKGKQLILTRYLAKKIVGGDQLYFETVNSEYVLGNDSTTLKLFKGGEPITYRSKPDLNSLPSLVPAEVVKWMTRARSQKLGKCTFLENTGASCKYYVQVRGEGYPTAAGCAKPNLMHAYCRGVTTEEGIVACLLRRAQVEGLCDEE